MAEVFLAVEERSGRRVAVKRLLPHVASDPDFVARFFHEIRIQATLKHPNVVELVDFDPSPDGGWLAMEFVDGGGLHQLLREAGRLPWAAALWATAEFLRGLGAAHARGIVHRDVKPQNVMWTRDGRVKITDFGVSTAEHLTRLTVEGTVVGTPAFMSPEQARGEPLDGRSDLFSAGTVLYALLTGKSPFAADSVAATLRRVAELEPEPPSLLDPSIPPAVDRVVRSLMHKERERRPATAALAVAAVEAVLPLPSDRNEGSAGFAALARDPSGRAAEERRGQAAEGRLEVERLLADRTAPPEEALWAAYRTVSVDPDDEEAKTLFATAAGRLGQRRTPVDNARIRALEEELRSDPENVALLLQLAKLYRLEKDFVGLMRFYRKLKDLAPADAYTQGQVASLLGTPAARDPSHPPGPRTVPGGHGGHAALEAPPAFEATGTPARSGVPQAALVGAAVVLLVAAGVFWLRGPGKRIIEPGAEERARAEAIVKRLKGAGSGASAEPARTNARSGDDPLQKALEKGALVEKEEGPARAADFYAREVPGLARPEARGVLLLALAEARHRARDEAGALAALDEAAALGGTARTKGLLARGELLDASGQDARATWEELSRGEDAAARTKAILRLALASDRGGDRTRALALYEDVLRRSPDDPEANAARLGAAALYRADGRTEDARRLWDEVKRRAPGTDFARSADEGLKSLE
jgi:tetratricopeptide (TPR) repeat protein